MLFANFRVDVIYAVWLCYGTEACCFVSEHRKQFAPLKMLLVSDSKRAPSPFAPEQGSSASTHGIITLCPRKLYYLKNKQTKKPSNLYVIIPFPQTLIYLTYILWEKDAYFCFYET